MSIISKTTQPQKRSSLQETDAVSTFVNSRTKMARNSDSRFRGLNLSRFDSPFSDSDENPFKQTYTVKKTVAFGRTTVIQKQKNKFAEKALRSTNKDLLNNSIQANVTMTEPEWPSMNDIVITDDSMDDDVPGDTVVDSSTIAVEDVVADAVISQEDKEKVVKFEGIEFKHESVPGNGYRYSGDSKFYRGDGKKYPYLNKYELRKLNRDGIVVTKDIKLCYPDRVEERKKYLAKIQQAKNAKGK